MVCDVRLVVELLRSTGETIGQGPLTPDWEPAIEWARLAGLQADGLWAAAAPSGPAIEPLWHATLGEPHVRGFRVHLASGGADCRFEDFPVSYFREQARALGAQLVDQGVLASGESFLYRVTAFAGSSAAAPAPPAPAIVAEDTSPPLTVIDMPLAPWLAASAPAAVEAAADPFPVFVPHDVIDQATALTMAAGESETGGFLIGHLHRAADAASIDARREFFVEVAALVPALHTVGSGARLTFTSDTWTSARATIALRGRGEQLLGWFHSHPQFAWCAARGCPAEAQRSCSRASGFLSEEDCLLHRTMFPRAFTLALLVTRTVGGCVPALFGWQQGLLARRAFRVVGAPPVAGR